MKQNDAWEMYENIRNDRRENLKQKVYKNKLKKSVIYGSVLAVILLFILLVAFIVWREFYEIKNEFYTYNIMEQLDYYYKDKFIILYPEDIDLKSNLTPNGKYIIKNKDGIEFTAYKDGSILHTDYVEKLCKKYFDEYAQEYDDVNVECLELVENYRGAELYKFAIEMQLVSFDNINDNVRGLNKLINYINKKVEKNINHTNFSYNILFKLNDFEEECSISYDSFKSENISEKLKIDYVNYLKDNAIFDENVDDLNMGKYYKPSRLNVYLNVGDDIENIKNYKLEISANYDVNFGDYRLSMVRIVSKFNNIEKCEAKLDGSIMNFTYKGKKYKFSGEAYGMTEIKGEKVPYEWNIEMIEKFFDVEVLYDLDNKRVIINT